MKPAYFSLCLCLLAQGPAFAQTRPLDMPPRLMAAALPDRGQAMTPLQRLVTLALERSPGTREAQANWRAAVQDADQARGALWPHLDLNANSHGVKLDGSKAQSLGGRVGATASYTLLDFGRVQDQVDARLALASSSQARILTAREATTFETVNAYMQLGKYQRLIRIYEAHIADLNTLADKLSEIVAVFVGRTSELTQARTRLGQAREGLMAMQAKKREYQLALMRQVGAGQVGENVDESMPYFPVEGVAPVLSAANLHHPAVVSARAEAVASRALAAEAHAARKPQLDVQILKQSGRDAAGQTSPTQLYVSAKWAAFQGFADKAAEQALIERAVAADEKVAQSLIEIEFNIHSAWAEYESQSSRLKELRSLVQGTDQVRKDYYTQWRDLGKRSLLDVLTAENEHLSTLLSLASSEVDQSLALARMRYEAGTLKDWLVGNDSTAVAADEVLDTAPEYAPAQMGALESNDVLPEESSPAPQLAQVGDVAG
jgi:adhesin transport system outer membrane protein